MKRMVLSLDHLLDAVFDARTVRSRGRRLGDGLGLCGFLLLVGQSALILAEQPFPRPSAPFQANALDVVIQIWMRTCARDKPNPAVYAFAVMAAIEVEDLRKSYGSVEAVRGVDITVSEGEVFALLGPNGAGKTTIVEILEGHRQRDGGRASVLGFDPARGERAFRERMGIVLQSTGVEPYLTVAESIEMYRGYYPSPRPLDEIIAVVGLEEKRNDRVKSLSGGQQRRLDVAIGLAGDPELLFLDEPTTGFDPGARRRMWDVMKNLVSLGKTIFLTTHYMEEAQELADRVAVITSGRIVAEGPPKTIAGREKARTIIRFRLPEGAPSLPPLLEEAAHSRDGSIELRVEDPVPALNELTSWALARNVQINALEVARPTLEDVYLQLTGAEGPE
jgi:ABC-2 type transport system ATP-binding protein